VVLVLINVDAGIPGATADAFFAKASSQVRGKQSIHFFLEGAKIAEGVITNYGHYKMSSLFLFALAGYLVLIYARERKTIIKIECGSVKLPKTVGLANKSAGEMGLSAAYKR
jgi:hypothetical protein